MCKRIITGITTGLIILCMVEMADALSLSLYSDYNNWKLDAGRVAMEDFNDETAGIFATKAFDGFSAQLINKNNGYLPSITTDGWLQLQEFNYNSELRFTFDEPTKAIGLNWRNSDFDNDQIEIAIGTTNIVIFGPGNKSGFLGIIANEAFNTVAFGDSYGNGGYLKYGAIDDIRFNSSKIIPTPVPAAVWLFGSGLVGLVGLRRKNKK